MKKDQPVRRSLRLPKKNEEKPSSVAGCSKSNSPDIPRTSLGRKRRASTVIDVNPKIMKKTIEGREIDGYCWICHKLGQDLICNSCPRVYHFDCTRKNLKFNALGSCAECQAQSVNGNKDFSRISRSSLKELLKFAMQEALRDKSSSKNQTQTIDNNKFCKFFKSWPDNLHNSDLCQIMDLKILIDKMNDDDPPYLTTAEFFSDVKWIYHNCYILHGSDLEITKTALKLKENFEQELLDIEACAECYFIKHSDDYVHADFFSKVCKKPHDIVWAKLKGHPYWPAKCLRIYNEHTDVRFFGTHDKSTVQLDQCFRISKKSPNKRENKQRQYLESISELSVYVSNYLTIYGTFPYHPVRTPLKESKSAGVKRRGRGRRKRKYGGNRSLNDSSLMETSFEIDQANNSFDETSMAEERENHKDVTPLKVKMTSEHSTIAASHSNLDFPANGKSYSECAVPATAESNVSDSIAVCMTFSADEEVGSINEINSRPQLISASASHSLDSESFSKSVLNSSSNRTSNFQSNPNISLGADITLPNKLETFNESVKSYSSDHSNMLPVITSTVSTSKGFSQEEVVSFTNENHVSQDPEIVSMIMDQLPSASSFPNAESQTAIHPLTTETNDFSNDDDIVIVKEQPGVSKAVSTIMNHSRLEQALCQVITSNKPQLQETLQMCQEFALKAFLKIWLSTNVKMHGDSEVEKFFQLYIAISNENNALKQENDAFQQENAALKKQKKNLEEELRRFEENPTLPHEGSKSTQEILISAVLNHVDKVSKTDVTAFQRSCLIENLRSELRSSYEKQIDLFMKKYKRWKKKAIEIKKDLEVSMEKCKKLENPNINNTNINTKFTQSTNLQTSSLDMSKNAVCHEKEMEAFSAQMPLTDDKNIQIDLKPPMYDKNMQTPSMNDKIVQTDPKCSTYDKSNSANLANKTRDPMYLDKRARGIKEKCFKETVTNRGPDLPTARSSETSNQTFIQDSNQQRWISNTFFEYSEESVSMNDRLNQNVFQISDSRQIFMPDYPPIGLPVTLHPVFEGPVPFVQSFPAPPFAAPSSNRPASSSLNSRAATLSSDSRLTTSSSDSRLASSSSDNRLKSKYRRTSRDKK